MKRELSQEELVKRWTLAPNELLLLVNKSGPGRLGSAAMLKFLSKKSFSNHSFGVFMISRAGSPPAPLPRA
jgi:hypothetical protein